MIHPPNSPFPFMPSPYDWYLWLMEEGKIMSSFSLLTAREENGEVCLSYILPTAWKITLHS